MDELKLYLQKVLFQYQLQLEYLGKMRAGIIAGWLPIGTATRNNQRVEKVEEIDSRLGRINFYISPKKLHEETGHIWRGEK